MIEAYCAGSCQDNGKPTQKAGCGIVLYATEGQRIALREFGYALGSSTSNVADIQAVTLALAAIADRKSDVMICTDSAYARSMLARGEDAKFTKIPNKNKLEIDELRKWFSAFTNVTVITSKKLNQAQLQHFTRAKSLANQGMKSQQDFDSQTRQLV